MFILCGQALIKMETDGSFFLKNLGKTSISVNGKAVATGQSLGLTSSCLIEVCDFPHFWVSCSLLELESGHVYFVLLLLSTKNSHRHIHF